MTQKGATIGFYALERQLSTHLCNITTTFRLQSILSMYINLEGNNDALSKITETAYYKLQHT